MSKDSKKRCRKTCMDESDSICAVRRYRSSADRVASGCHLGVIPFAVDWFLWVNCSNRLGALSSPLLCEYWLALASWWETVEQHPMSDKSSLNSPVRNHQPIRPLADPSSSLLQHNKADCILSTQNALVPAHLAISFNMPRTVAKSSGINQSSRCFHSPGGSTTFLSS